MTPGGVVNYVSKQPRQKQFTELTAARGSYEFQRYGLETTGPLIRDQLFYLLNATYIFNGSNMQHYYSNIFLYSGTLTYQFTPATSVTAAWERQQQAQNDLQHAAARYRSSGWRHVGWAHSVRRQGERRKNC